MHTEDPMKPLAKNIPIDSTNDVDIGVTNGVDKGAIDGADYVQEGQEVPVIVARVIADLPDIQEICEDLPMALETTDADALATIDFPSIPIGTASIIGEQTQYVVDPVHSTDKVMQEKGKGLQVQGGV